jgi:toxin ParE1/3/4
MRLSYHSRARQELTNAASWYQHERTGLGQKFLDDYKATLVRILAHPEAHAVVWGTCRLASLKTFPYGIVYRIGDNVIHIDCIRHPRFGFGRK